MTQLAILGRLPALSLAELEAVVGAPAVRPLGRSAAALTMPVDLNALGGVIKLADQQFELPVFDWDNIILTLASPEALALLPADGKLTVGLSVYGTATSRDVMRHGLELKKHLGALGRGVRLVPNSTPELSSAQVFHNNLTGRGTEWLIIDTGKGVVIGRTTAVQDIEAYGARDHGRPERSAKVGMLPPKLAQIMINLAQSEASSIILDPFCGTGVVLQEAERLGYGIYGSDISSELIEMSRINLHNEAVRLEVGDATTHAWQQPIGAVVTEGYLGPALTSPPNDESLKKLCADARALTFAFLRNLSPQITSGTAVVMALPAWRHGKGYTGLGILDQISDLGYTVKQFEHAPAADLIYYRPDQIVARELAILRRT